MSDKPTPEQILEKFWAKARYTKDVRGSGSFTEALKALQSLYDKRFREALGEKKKGCQRHPTPSENCSSGMCLAHEYFNQALDQATAKWGALV